MSELRFFPEPQNDRTQQLRSQIESALGRPLSPQQFQTFANERNTASEGVILCQGLSELEFTLRSIKNRLRLPDEVIASTLSDNKKLTGLGQDVTLSFPLYIVDTGRGIGFSVSATLGVPGNPGVEQIAPTLLRDATSRAPSLETFVELRNQGASTYPGRVYASSFEDLRSLAMAHFSSGSHESLAEIAESLGNVQKYMELARIVYARIADKVNFGYALQFLWQNNILTCSAMWNIVLPDFIIRTPKPTKTYTVDEMYAELQRAAQAAIPHEVFLNTPESQHGELPNVVAVQSHEEYRTLLSLLQYTPGYEYFRNHAHQRKIQEDFEHELEHYRDICFIYSALGCIDSIEIDLTVSLFKEGVRPGYSVRLIKGVPLSYEQIQAIGKMVQFAPLSKSDLDQKLFHA